MLGAGGYLPERVLTNEALSRLPGLETSDSWIYRRTGIKQRHIAHSTENCSDLASHAARAALERVGLGPQDIDLVLVATTTPDNTFPATASRVQHALGINKGAAFDVQAVCAGFIFALATADNMLRLGQAHCALVIGAEVYSRILDWTDRKTCILFGDGAGAVVLQAQEQSPDEKRGLWASRLRTDGSYYHSLYVDGGPGEGPQDGGGGGLPARVGVVRMNGQEVYRWAIEYMVEVVQELTQFVSLDTRAIDWLVPHQANQRIIAAVGERLTIPMERTVSTVHEHANISAATIPYALSRAQDRFATGDLIALTALGGGYAWGGHLLYW